MTNLETRAENSPMSGTLPGETFEGQLKRELKEYKMARDAGKLPGDRRGQVLIPEPNGLTPIESGN